MKQLLRMSSLEQRSCPCFHLPGLDKQTHPALTNDLLYPCKYPSAPPFPVFFLRFCFCTFIHIHPHARPTCTCHNHPHREE